MTNQHDSKPDANAPLIYQIRIQGQLDRQWAVWFVDMTITWSDNGETILTGPVVDQAALYALLRKVRDLGLPLIAVTKLPPDQADAKE